MKRTAAYRFTADICFYYAILSIFPFLAPMHGPMALFAAASLAVSLAAVYVPWAPLRFVLALLPGLAFLTARPAFMLVFPALAWVYLILVLTAGRFSVWLEDYRRSYWVMLAACLLSMGGSILLCLIKPGFALILPGMYYGTAFLCLGVFAMRRLQMNAEMSLHWNLANGAAVIGVPLLAAGCSALLWQLLRLMLRLLKPVVDYLRPIVKRCIVWLVNTILPIDPDVPAPTPTPRPTLTPEEAAITEPGWATPTPRVDFGWEIDPALFEKARRVGVIALLVLLVLALLALILYRARRNRTRAGQETVFEETEEGRPSPRRKKAGSAGDASDARKIRSIYRKYMQAMRKQGVQIRKGSTSRDILNEAEQISLSPGARRLRELYLAARYGEGDAVTPQDVREAALCLRQVLDGRDR